MTDDMDYGEQLPAEAIREIVTTLNLVAPKTPKATMEHALCDPQLAKRLLDAVWAALDAVYGGNSIEGDPAPIESMSDDRVEVFDRLLDIVSEIVIGSFDA